MFGFAVIIQDHEYVAKLSFAVMQHATRIRFSLTVVLKLCLGPQGCLHPGPCL